jgi:hypothetical protein
MSCFENWEFENPGGKKKKRNEMISEMRRIWNAELQEQRDYYV